jgi:hypothetical protein
MRVTSYVTEYRLTCAAQRVSSFHNMHVLILDVQWVATTKGCVPLKASPSAWRMVAVLFEMPWFVIQHESNVADEVDCVPANKQL